MEDSHEPHVRYDVPAPFVARITLCRPAKRNAQGVKMTFELDEAFARACHDDDINVIILAGEGDHFCAGHDLSPGNRELQKNDLRGLWGQFEAPGVEGRYDREKEIYLGLTERWRNAPKPTIAAVQGAVIAGGLMLAWACDLIICADDTRFRDNTAAEMGVPGVEFFMHPYELGVRKAKEFLFTGAWLSAIEAERRGMVNHVVPRADLGVFSLDLAKRIATNNRFAMKLAKEAINNAQDAMGRPQAMSNAYSLHQLGHAHNIIMHGAPIDISKLDPGIRDYVRRRFAKTPTPGSASSGGA